MIKKTDLHSGIFNKLCVISAPSGAGKTSLIKKICANPSIEVCISETTRPPRKGEVDGIDYVYIDKEDFQLRVKNESYVEHALVHGNYTGLSSSIVKKRNSGDFRNRLPRSRDN